jgi:hypothetical protein
MRRHYKLRRIWLAAYPFAAVMVLAALSIAVAPGGGLLLPVVGAAIVLLAVWFTRRGMRIGVEVGPDEIVVYGPVRTQRLLWHDVAGVSTHRWSINRVVDLKLADGRTVNTNLIQGASVGWRGGKTTDILSVLQGELDSHRAPVTSGQLAAADARAGAG